MVSMGIKKPLPLLSLLLLAAVPALAMPHIHRGPTAHRVSRHMPKRVKRTTPRAMDSTRATEIQTGLIRKGYLAGAPSGVWDSQTQAAMEKYQSDHGWQTKLTPDSRAIIKLGLGSSTTPAAAWVKAPTGESAATSLASAGPSSKSANSQ